MGVELDERTHLAFEERLAMLPKFNVGDINNTPVLQSEGYTSDGSVKTVSIATLDVEHLLDKVADRLLSAYGDPKQVKRAIEQYGAHWEHCNDSERKNLVAWMQGYMSLAEDSVKRFTPSSCKYRAKQGGERRECFYGGNCMHMQRLAISRDCYGRANFCTPSGS